MSKGSGRRRITPSDGLQYDAETDMTNIEERGGSYRQSASRELILGIRTGAQPTAHNDYGSHGGSGSNGRYGGVGRKNDHRNWKGYTRGKQYQHNLDAQEAIQEKKPVPEGVARRLREKSINALEGDFARRRMSYKPHKGYKPYVARPYTPTVRTFQQILRPTGWALLEEKVRRIREHVGWYGFELGKLYGW